jgi:hypothetical protein
MGHLLRWQGRGLHVRFEGEVQVRDILTMARTAQADERFDRLRYTVNDFSDCTLVDGDDDAMEEFAANDYAAGLTNPDIRIALVPDTPQVRHLMERYCSMGLVKWPVRVFPSAEAASGWLERGE